MGGKVLSYNRQSKKYWRETWKAYLFLLPSLVILGVFTLWPIVFSLVLSFFKWDYTSASRYFIGLDNYKELFRISYPVQMNLFYSIINMAVYVVKTLVLVQIVH
jgi:multiple sugar transport system permease protein